MKKVYVNAQWQGGADRSTYDGAEELRKYLPGRTVHKIEFRINKRID
ncbi:MAG: hypothetical protein U0L10_16250 [Lachnospiraceae bacterium]|nr:hypothetical protein [Lachnospiraceae bacterium]